MKPPEEDILIINDDTAPPSRPSAVPQFRPQPRPRPADDDILIIE